MLIHEKNEREVCRENWPFPTPSIHNNLFSTHFRKHFQGL